eukprot:TRINITY_DN22672_c0_g1_i2.p2 TRINITY_DN22672_c0_g1~~TRINITY_DN22672_c0_g1_i2.p2  ORF type:complete len:215 (+),score=24.89 TRINITY_DN22672_c0_g1_i2:103-747(+)
MDPKTPKPQNPEIIKCMLAHRNLINYMKKNIKKNESVAHNSSVTNSFSQPLLSISEGERQPLLHQILATRVAQQRNPTATHKKIFASFHRNYVRGLLLSCGNAGNKEANTQDSSTAKVKDETIELPKITSPSAFNAEPYKSVVPRYGNPLREARKETSNEKMKESLRNITDTKRSANRQLLLENIKSSHQDKLIRGRVNSVSYTHLTLPTICSV